MYQLYAQIIDGKTVPTFNRKITETEATTKSLTHIYMTLTHIYMTPNTHIHDP